MQVADSLCCQLHRYPHHHFIIVLSSYMKKTRERIGDVHNIDFYEYDVKNNIRTILFGRDSFLDGLVESNHIDKVLTVFGPSRWNPQCAHLSGWAIPHLLIPESPYFKRLSIKDWIIIKLRCRLWKYMFERSSKYFWTENPAISERVRSLLPNKTVFSVTNYYNQIFDQPNKWRKAVTLPAFEGTTCLTISTYYPYKNLEILIDVAKYLEEVHPDFNFRFVLSIQDGDMKVPSALLKHFEFIGRVDISDCPYLYEQSDIMIMPSLLECFTATYPEAMKMKVPIVTTDMFFAKGLCGDAACYYSAVDVKEAAEAVYKVATDKVYSSALIEKGLNRLKSFEDYITRADKLVDLVVNEIV